MQKAHLSDCNKYSLHDQLVNITQSPVDMETFERVDQTLLIVYEKTHTPMIDNAPVKFHRREEHIKWLNDVEYTHVFDRALVDYMKDSHKCLMYVDLVPRLLRM